MDTYEPFDITRVALDGVDEFLCHGCGEWTSWENGGDSDERFDGAEFLCSECWCDIDRGLNLAGVLEDTP